MHCITPNRRTLVDAEVVDFEKRRVPSKHYAYIINVSWSDGSETVIYRRYSMFFDFQIILLETFPWEGGLKEPSARKIPFLPGKILFRRSHIRDVAQKRLKPINEYCKAIVKLPKHISHCNHVLDFFESKPEDLNPIKEGSRRHRKDEQEISEITGPLLLEPYVAVADYLSTQQKELSIHNGEKLEVIEKNENGWWFVSNEEGERGWVPGVYLEKPDGTAEDLVTKRADPGQGEQYVTTHSYTAENSDEISFGAGVTVEVLQKNLEGWWLIRYNGKQGNAPASYLEKQQQNWSLPNKVEIISSIRDLKQHQTQSENSAASEFARKNNFTQSSATANTFASQEPRSPLSSSYNRTVQPPPKRSSIKAGIKKRPGGPPPLPPSLTQEPTYEYLTVAPFDATIPDGVSFQEDKKVQVLEKSPGGWWFVKVDGEEGWAPASFIEKRETVKPKVNVPVRPKLPNVQRPTLKPTKPNGVSSSVKPSAVRKGSLNGITISHPILQSSTSMPVVKSEASPASRPLPPLPQSKPSTQSKTLEDTYEDIADTKTQPIKLDKAPLPSKITKRPSISNENSSDQESGKVDFRSVLKSNRALKPVTNQPKPVANQPKPVTGVIPNPGRPEPPKKVESQTRPKPSWVKQESESTIKSKAAGFEKFGLKPTNLQPTDNGSNVLKPSALRPSSAKKPQAIRPANGPPKLPSKPKPVPLKSRYDQKIVPSDSGVVTDFRSVLRSTQSRNTNSSNSAKDFQTSNSTTKKPGNLKENQDDAPVVPKKPSNLALKPLVPSKLKGFDQIPDGEDSSSSNGPSLPQKPPVRPEKPATRRFQSKDNSDLNKNSKKSVFTVAHVQIEHKNPNLGDLLTKRGSPDGQVDSIFENCDSLIPVAPPERKKKQLRAAKNTTLNDSLNRIVIAVCDYHHTEETGISFFYGDKAEVLDESEPDWWYIKIADKMGWAPSNYFKSVEVDSPTVEHNQESVYSEIEGDDHHSRFPAQYIALADFEAQEPSMVSLRTNDRVTVTQEAQGGWWYAILIDGEGEGWVPSTYLDPL